MAITDFLKTCVVRQIKNNTTKWVQRVNRPSIFSLEIVKRAYENKNCEVFIDHKRKKARIGRGENVPFSRAPLSTQVKYFEEQKKTSMERLK